MLELLVGLRMLPSYLFTIGPRPSRVFVGFSWWFLCHPLGRVDVHRRLLVATLFAEYADSEPFLSRWYQ
jgi:hypothetical protein